MRIKKTDNKWKIFVMFHKILKEENYLQDPGFIMDRYSFIKANERFLAEYNADFFNEIKYENELQFYNKDLQKKNYFAPSIIYHIFKNKLHYQYKYVGFMEYDIPLTPPHNVTWKSFTEEVEKIISVNDRVIMPFRYVHKISRLRSQKDITLCGENSIDKIFELYNEYWGENHKVEDYLDEFITTQQSFLCDQHTFNNVLLFISHLIENKVAESRNTWPLPATIFERAFGIALLLERDVSVVVLPMTHQNMELWKMPGSIFNKLLRKIKKVF